MTRSTTTEGSTHILSAGQLVHFRATQRGGFDLELAARVTAADLDDAEMSAGWRGVPMAVAEAAALSAIARSMTRRGYPTIAARERIGDGYGYLRITWGRSLPRSAGGGWSIDGEGLLDIVEVQQ